MMKLVLVSSFVMQLGDAAPSSSAPCATVAPVAVGYSTTPAICNTPLCKGLVGAAAGVAGLGVIGGITAGAVMRNHHAPTGPPPIIIGTTQRGIVLNRAAINTAAPSIFAREQEAADLAEEESNWLFPLLLGLLGLCCILGIIGMVCMNMRKTKRSAMTRGVAPQHAYFPLRQATPYSYVPQVVPTVAMPAPTYAGALSPRSMSFQAGPPVFNSMPPPIVPTVAMDYSGYGMAAPGYGPEYGMAAPGYGPGGFATPGYGPGYGAPNSII